MRVMGAPGLTSKQKNKTNKQTKRTTIKHESEILKFQQLRCDSITKSTSLFSLFPSFVLSCYPVHRTVLHFMCMSVCVCVCVYLCILICLHNEAFILCNYNYLSLSLSLSLSSFGSSQLEAVKGAASRISFFLHCFACVE